MKPIEVQYNDKKCYIIRFTNVSSFSRAIIMKEDGKLDVVQTDSLRIADPAKFLEKFNEPKKVKVVEEWCGGPR